MRSAAAGMFFGVFTTLACAQSVVSIRSGLVHYIEGQVLLDDKPAAISKFGQFPQVRNESTLRTREGRAEILLSPGSFLRLAENSAFRMENDDLADTRVVLLEGEALLELTELTKGNSIRVKAGEAVIVPTKEGLYRIDAQAGVLKVFEGRAKVTLADVTKEFKKGREVSLQGAELASVKFDPNVGDPLYRWSSRRSSYIAMANLSGARSIYRSGLTYGSSQWLWNPYFGLMTFIPARATCWSPFGFAYYTPGSVMDLYTPRPIYAGGGGSDWTPRWNPNLGYSTVGGRSYGGFPSASTGAAPAAAPSAAAGGGAAASPRGSDAAVGRGDGGGRGR